MAEVIAIDRQWLGDHPLPLPSSSTDKDDRGHVLVIGGSRKAPGGLRLTGEAALRAGAGRVQLATLECLALPLGLAIPEAGVLALDESKTGEIAWRATEAVDRAMARCSCLVAGPAMTDAEAGQPIVDAVLAGPREGLAIVLDAAVIAAAAGRKSAIQQHRGRVVITPNRGEMAGLLGTSVDDLASDPAVSAREAVERTGATVVFKGPRTLVATPEGELLAYEGGGSGLATGGSGDVLAGILGGLLARGAATLEACGWAVWLHGEAGRELARGSGALGYLARELPARVPSLLRAD